jgi:hypothetical protein
MGGVRGDFLRLSLTCRRGDQFGETVEGVYRSGTRLVEGNMSLGLKGHWIL